MVTNVRAEIKLPTGGDGVVGDVTRDPPFAPGEPEYDNPLRIARTEAGRENIKPVLAPGQDGKSGTADDVDTLAPQGSGNAEFLVEGVREGAQIVDIEIRGTLQGLPGGPVEVAGVARGAVLVRDPDFSLTFIHPDTVRAGEGYELIAHIQNTSNVDANLVSVSLDAANLSGARLLDPADATQTVDTIPAGESATVTFPLEALRTGQVTATTLELQGAENIVSGRRLSVRTGISEDGVPLSPDTLILPPAVSFLREQANNADLTFRAVALLGQAHSIATAPRGSLPAGVLPIPASTVTQRAGEFSEAARRLELSYLPNSEGIGELRPDGLLLTLEDLYFDFLGVGFRDSGWDAMYGRSRQARLFGDALAEVVHREAGANGIVDLIGLQRHWADTESYRTDHVTLMTQSSDGTVPVALKVVDGLDRSLGGALDPELNDYGIPGADILRFGSLNNPGGQFAVVTELAASSYTAELIAQAAGSFDFGVVIPGADGELRQVVYRNITVAAGDSLTVVLQPRSDAPVTLEQNSNVLTATSEEVIPDGPPQILGIVQDADKDVDEFGRVVGVLFDEEVDRASAQDPASYQVSDATIPMIPPPELVDTNSVSRGAVQFGGRIVLVGLRDPVGPFVKRRLDVTGVRDLEGRVMVPETGHLVLPDPDIDIGAQVTGRVLRSDGTPVSNAQVEYYQYVANKELGGICTRRLISAKSTDEAGAFDLDFVADADCDDPFEILARDPATGEQGSLLARVRTDGERLSLPITLVGRGSLDGTVRDEAGQALTGVKVSVTSITDGSKFATQTDQSGYYRINRIPVGAVSILAEGTVGVARASGNIAGPDTLNTVDFTLFNSQPQGVITGVLRLPDGTVVRDTSVFLLKDGQVVAVAKTDASGTYRFDMIAPGSYSVRAVDAVAGLQGESNFTVENTTNASSPVFVTLVFSGTGSVSGTVLEHAGNGTVPVAGAQVAGGTQLVTADDQGHYEILAVPVGVRTIEALNPVTGARGSREITILSAGQVSQNIDIVLDPPASVTGRVFDPDGQPVAGQEVRLIVDDHIDYVSNTRIFQVRKTTTASDGTYLFDQIIDFKEYPVVAVRGNEIANGTAHFTSTFLQNVVDLHLVRPTGRVSGQVVDETSLAVAAKVTIKARVPNAAGELEYKEAASITSDPDQGFSFGNLFPGPFAVTATSFFSPESTTQSGQLTVSNPVVEGLTLVLIKNTGTLRGCVYTPDGDVLGTVLDEQGVPRPLSVFITSRALRDELARDTQNPEPEGIRVDASTGCFVSSIPLPPDYYTLQVTDDRAGSPTFGLTAQSTASVRQGVETQQDITLLGLGDLAIEVVDGMGNAVPGVEVTIRHSSYPNDVRETLVTEPTDTAPLVFTGVTEGPVGVSATVSTDPSVDVGGRDELRGFGGSATGTVIRGGVQVVRVVIDAAGKITGHFFMPDGSTPVPNAQVELSKPGGGTAYDVTDAAGRFDFEGIALGSFKLHGFDPATGRSGEATGRVDVDGQTVTTNMRLGFIGTVRGTVLGADLTSPVPGVEVRLTVKGENRYTTAGLDGIFSFESVPGGPLTLTAVASNGLSGQSQGSLTLEGQSLVLDVILGGSGQVGGKVFDANGVPVGTAEVTLRPSLGEPRVQQTVASGSELGSFTFDEVPLGSFTVEARPLGALIPGDGGRAAGQIDFNSQSVSTDIHFQGTISVAVTVTGEVGASPIDVSVGSGGLFGGKAAPTTFDGSAWIFEGIPRAALTVSAKQTTPVGSTVSDSATFSELQLPAVGERLDVALTLSEVATVSGRVTDATGSPVVSATVSIAAGGVNALALSASDGTFEFLGVPLNTSLRVVAVATNGGIAVFDGSVDAQGVIRKQDNTALSEVVLTLDADPPAVKSVFPASGTITVPTGASVIVVFSEPIDPGTIRTCTSTTGSSQPTLLLREITASLPEINDPANPCDDSNVILANVAVTPDGTTATLTPLQPTSDTTQYSFVVSRGLVNADGDLVGGVRDLVGHALVSDYASQFTTRDETPPGVVTVSPTDAAIFIAEDSVIRVTFSEPVNPESVTSTTIWVEGPNGLVAGQLDLIQGNTVLVFTPTDANGDRAYFETNASYTLVITAIQDMSGNTITTDNPVSSTFSTPDTIPPVISAVTAPAQARAGETITVSALTTATDVASVDLYVDGSFNTTVAVAYAAGEYRASLVMPAAPITVAARAVDKAGNIGALSASTSITLQPDTVPVVQISAPAEGTVLLPGDSVSLMAQANDDVGVAVVEGAVSGLVSYATRRDVTPPQPAYTASFDIQIPADAPSGVLTFATFAKDTKNQLSATVSRSFEVQDPFDPEVTINTPSEGDHVLAGDVLNVNVTATDAAGIAEVALAVPAIGLNEAVTINPAQTNVTYAFSVPVPASFQDSTLNLVAQATDRSGRQGSVETNVSVLGPFVLNATAQRGLPGDTELPSANVLQTVEIIGQGLDSSQQVFFVTVDDLGNVSETAMPLFAISSDGTTALVQVPTLATTGAVRIESPDGTVLPSQPQLQIVPAIDDFSVPAGSLVAPGVIATLTGTGFREAFTEVEFPGIGRVPAYDVSDGNTRLTVVIPQGVVAGSVRVSTNGGTSSGIPIAGAFGLVGSAAEGVALDPTLPSANTGQAIIVKGAGLTDSMTAVFHVFDPDGQARTLDVPLINVSSDTNRATVTVPQEAITGLVQLRLGSGDLLPETAELQIVPTIASLDTISGPFQPGAPVVVTGSGFRVANTRVEFSGALPAAADEVPLGSRLFATVPAGVTTGSVKVITDGGTSSGLTLPGTFGLVGTASQGMPANATEASVNAGQGITVTGTGLTSEFVMVFPGIDDNGFAVTREAPLVDVSPDGMQATVVVPDGTVTGPVRLRHLGSSLPAEESVLLQVVPTLVSLQLPPGELLATGLVVTLTGSGFAEGMTEVEFVGQGRLLAEDVFSDGRKLTITIPAGFNGGEIKAVTAGGESPPLAVRNLSVSITTPPANASVVLDVLAPVEAEAVSSAGIVAVEFFVQEVSIGVDTTSPYTAQYQLNTCPADGTVTLRVVARDASDQVAENEVTLVCDSTDTDGDGLPDAVDPDDDNDGLSDVLEIQLGLNPLRVDSDGDGIPDGNEDSDGDKLTNLDELQRGLQPGNPDSDGDGISDGVEIELGFDPLDPIDALIDTDGDGLPDWRELLLGSDPALQDTDGDGRLDGEEALLDGTDLLNPADTRLIREISTGGAVSDQAMPFVDQDGNLHLVWVDLRDNAQGEIYYKMLSRSGVTLIGDTRVTNDSTASTRPAVVVDSSGRVTIVWQDAGSGHSQIHYVQLDPSQHPQDGSSGQVAQLALGPASIASTDPSIDHEQPRLAVDVQDRVHLVWENTALGSVRYARIGAGGEIDIPDQAVVTGDTSHTRLHPTVTTDSAGYAHIAVSAQLNTCAKEIHYLMLDGTDGSVRIAPTRLTGDDCVPSTRPTIATGQDDIVTLLFRNEPSLAGEIVFRRIAPGLDDQNGNAAVSDQITVQGDLPVSGSDVVSADLPAAALDGKDGWRVTYYNGFVAGVSSELFYTVANANGEVVVKEQPLTTGPDAGAALSNETLGFVAIDGATSYVVWTDTTGIHPKAVVLAVGPDNDSDGLTNAMERVYGTDPNNPDSDGDFLQDGFEVDHALDPMAAVLDPDEDGLNNDTEIAIGTDPLNPDTDSDSFLDGEEVEYLANPLDSNETPLDTSAAVGLQEASGAAVSVLNTAPVVGAEVSILEANGAAVSVLNTAPVVGAEVSILEANGAAVSVLNTAPVVGAEVSILEANGAAVSVLNTTPLVGSGVEILTVSGPVVSVLNLYQLNQPDQLILNGSFETGATPQIDTFITIQTGNPAIDDWVVSAGSVDWVGTNYLSSQGTLWPASDGNYSLDMSGTSAGTIYQDFSTEVGAEYQVVFDIAANPSPDPPEKTLRVYANDEFQDFTSPSGIVWDEKTFVFTAQSPSTRLKFESLTSGLYGPALDNVRVYKTASLNDGLVTYYPFDGNVNDASGNTNNGAVVGGVTLTTDRFGTADSAYSFNGTDGYILADGDGLPTSERTVSLWFRLDSLNYPMPVLLGYGGGPCGTSWWMAAHPEAPAYGLPMGLSISSHCGANTMTLPYDLQLGQWYHWVVTTSSTGTRMYVNGVEEFTSASFIDNTQTVGTDLAIGVDVGAGGSAPYTDSNVAYTQGALDEIRIYDRALTASEVQMLFAQ